MTPTNDSHPIKLTYAIFDDERDASHAVETLLRGPFLLEEVTVCTRSSDAERTEPLPIERHTRITKHAPFGAAIGAVVGGIGLVMLEPWLAAGALLLALQGAVFGGATGTAIAILSGLDWEDFEIELDAEHFPPGAFLVGALSKQRTDVARHLLREAGATRTFVRIPGTAFEAFSHPDYIPPPDPVQEAGDESFPASDAPSWNPPGR